MSLLTCRALAKRYGRTLALDGLDLQLEAGEPIALIGPNGAGKTTFLSILCGFIHASAGEVEILGESPGARSLSGRLAALPQDASLDPHLSIGRQLRLFAELQGMSRKAARTDVSRVLKTVALTDAEHKKPGVLSHGMRKRISIAQALLGSPELVLLDEPTAGIDPPNSKMIRDLIRRESSRTTFIVSSHNLDELERLCQSVIYLEKGRLQSHGRVIEENRNDIITLRLGDVPEAEFFAACLALPGIRDVQRTAQGDYLIQAKDDMRASLDLLQLLVGRGWRYRQLSRGRSLEERLYGA